MKKIVTKIIFAIYLLLLVWVIIFKLNLPFTPIRHVRQLNLIPFYGTVHFAEPLLNVLVFIPFGFLLRRMWNTKIYFYVLSAFAASLLFETVQYIFAIGVSDITDLFTNTLGGTIGLGLALVLEWIRVRIKQK